MEILARIKAALVGVKRPRFVIPTDWQEVRITPALRSPDDAQTKRLIASIIDALTSSEAGAFDEYEELGHEARQCFYLMGPSADHMLEVLTPVLKQSDWALPAEIYCAYGNPMDPQTRESIIEMK